MGNTEINHKIQQVIDTFGMKDDVVAKAMNITVGTVRKNRSEKVTTHKFNPKNYSDLVTYIKNKASEL